MAKLPTEIYHKMKRVFEMHEECSLQGQRERKMSKANFKKMMEGKFSAKLQNFKTFQGLEVCIS